MLPDDLRFTAINAPGPNTYPIVSQTFIIVHTDLCQGGMSDQKAQVFKAFIDFGLSSDGQNAAKELSYAPLPRQAARQGEGPGRPSSSATGAR